MASLSIDRCDRLHHNDVRPDTVGVEEDAGPLTDTPRYQRLAEPFGAPTEQVTCGCHVHACVPERDLAVQVGNHPRRWLPTRPGRRRDGLSRLTVEGCAADDSQRDMTRPVSPERAGGG
ncbi:glutamate-cysteine ligase family protein [Nocardia salmonicida]|uniref:glutamate-cysteine ligase family protein n=1 Tax=Nocardia salmonicida TaxID=53431 RepID=UPI0036727D27